MKVKLIASDEHYDGLAQELHSLGIEIDEEASLVLQETDVWLNHLTCRKENELQRVAAKEIVYIESLSHNVLVHTAQDVYKVKERLWQLDNQLNPQEFLRISNSVIVARVQIKSIKPALSQKFLLTMSDGSKVDVTRTYYHAFREAMGI